MGETFRHVSVFWSFETTYFEFRRIYLLWNKNGNAANVIWFQLIIKFVIIRGNSKASAHNAGDPSSIPGLGRSPGEGNGNPLQYSCLENSMDGGAWWATVHGVTKSWTQLSDFTTSQHILSAFDMPGTILSISSFNFYNHPRK